MNNCREEEQRTAVLLGMGALERLHHAHVAVFGVGGVGGYACEALARAGVGELTLIDGDNVSLSNINRQIIALHSTVGRPKVEVMRERVLDIHPDCRVHALRVFYLPGNADGIPLDAFDYIVDAIDTVAAKLELAVRAARQGVPLISAMGAGNKADPAGFAVADVYATVGCPLARVMRRELRRRGVDRLKVVYSPEPPLPPAPYAPDTGSASAVPDAFHNAPYAPEAENISAAPEAFRQPGVPDSPTDQETSPAKAHRPEAVPAGDLPRPGKRVPGSLPYMPGIAGLMLAGEVIRDLCARP